MPLGAAALAGTSYPIDRQMTADLLGFSRPSANSLDSVSDRDFAIELFRKTMLNAEHFDKIIEGQTPNWDKDRIADVDAILIRMAICEFQKFSSIPTRVTINEYIEIAKEYATPKSSIFINGVLDNLEKQMNEKGLINKVGRGLL